MIVSDNLSTDDTRYHLGMLAKEFNVLPISDGEVLFDQSRKMTKLAHMAHDLGAEWIVPFDADELWCGINSLRDELGSVLSVPMKNYFATRFDDVTDLNPFTREKWRSRNINPLNKVCFRWQENIVVEPGNHHVSLNGQFLPEYTSSYLEIGHFQNRTPQQFITKIRREAKGYEGLNKPNIGYWHKFGHLSDQDITEWWVREYYFPEPKDAGMVLDPAPYKGK